MKKNIKLLATASTLAMLTFDIHGINAAVKTNTIGSDATLINGGGTNVRTTANILSVFNDNDSFYFSSANSLSTGGSVTIAAIGVAGLGTTFTINHDTTLGSVGTLFNKKLAITVTDGETLTLSGTQGVGKNAAPIGPNFYGGLGGITLGNGSGLIVDAPITLSAGSNINGAGTLIFNGDGTVNSFIGNTNALNSIVLNGNNAKQVTFGSTVNAELLDITNGANAQFNQNADFDEIRFRNNASVVKIADNRQLNITGNQVNYNLDAAKIKFDGADSVLKLSSVAGVNVVATLTSDLNSGVNDQGIVELHANGADSTLEISRSALGNANFFKEIKVTGDQGVTLNSSIKTNLLTVSSDTFTATDASVIDTTKINIDPNSSFYFIPSVNVGINANAANQIVFTDNTSKLALIVENGDQVTFTLQNDIDPTNDNSGVIILESVGDDGALIPQNSKLTLTSNGGVKTLGVPLKHLAQLLINTNEPSIITNLVDIRNVNELLIDDNAQVDIQTNTIAFVPLIKIGNATGLGILTFDTAQGNTNLLNLGQVIKFENADSNLVLKNSGNADRIITLSADLAPNVGGGTQDLQGIVEINSNGTHKLGINDPGDPGDIGLTLAERINILKLSGNQRMTINSRIFAKDIQITNTSQVDFNGQIDAGLNGILDLQSVPVSGINLNANSNIPTIKTNNNRAKMKIANGMSLKVDSISRADNTPGATLVLGDGSSLSGYAGGDVRQITLNLMELTKDATLAGGNYFCTELKAIKAGNVNLGNNFNLVGNINSSGLGAANLIFAGSARITGSIGQIRNPVGAISVGANGTLELRNHVYAAGIDGNAANNETLKFANALSVNSPVGNTAKFKTIEFNGGNVQFNTKKINTDKFLFTAIAPVTVITADINIGASQIENTSGVNAHTIQVKGVDQNFAKPVGAAGDRIFFGTIQMGSDNEITVGAVDFYANLTTSVDGEGSVDITGNNMHGKIGVYDFDGINANTRFNEVKFSESSSAKDIAANTIRINPGKIATFNGDNTVFTTMNMGANAVANFMKNFPFSDIADKFDLIKGATFFNIKTPYGSGAKINFNGIAAVTELTGFDQINFNSDSVLFNDIDAKATKFNDSAYIINDLSISGNVNFNNTDIVLGFDQDKDLSFKNGTVSFNGAVIVNTTIQNQEGLMGNLVLNNGSIMKVNGSLKFIVDNTAGLFSGERITVIRNNGGQTPSNIDNITVESDKLSSWFKERDPKTGNIIFTSQSRIKETITEIMNNAGIPESEFSQDTIDVMSQALPNTQVYNFDKELASMTNSNVVDAVLRIRNSNNIDIEQITTGFTNSIEQIIASRISNFTNFTPITNPQINIEPTEIIAPVGVQFTKKTAEAEVFAGIAAGDDPARFGIWVAPMYAESIQSTTTTSAGYRAKTAGVTLGYDAKINDDMIAGAAISPLSTNAKFKGYKNGDRTHMDSVLFSLYAIRQLTNNFFVQGLFTFGSNKIQTKEFRRIANTATPVATGNYTSMLFSTELLIGYNHLTSGGFLVTPITGVEYKHANDASYYEIGTRNQNRKITKKANDKIDFVAGLRISPKAFMLGELQIAPEIHGFIRQDLSDKKIEILIDMESGRNVPFAKNSITPIKTQSTIGFGVNAKYQLMDYGMSYDVNISKKFLGQQGSIKMRVNF